MSLQEKLFLMWFRRRVKTWRSDMKLQKMWKLLDGWKLVIAVLLGLGAAVWDQLTNGHSGDIVGAILTALGWAPGVDWTGPEMAKVAASLLGIVAFVHKLIKAQRQAAAGADITERLSLRGYVKEAVEQGIVQVQDGTPVVPMHLVEIKPEQVSFVAKILYGLLKTLLGGKIKIGKVDIPLPYQTPTIGGDSPFDKPHLPGGNSGGFR